MESTCRRYIRYVTLPFPQKLRHLRLLYVDESNARRHFGIEVSQFFEEEGVDDDVGCPGQWHRRLCVGGQFWSKKVHEGGVGFCNDVLESTYNFRENRKLEGCRNVLQNKARRRPF